MKSASDTMLNQLPETPQNDVTGGLDWSRDDHAVSVVDARGREIVRHAVEHSAAGPRELIDVLREAGAWEVAIERPDGPVVDALLTGGITVVVISPNQVTCAAAMARPATRTTASTRSCSPTPCAPTAPGCAPCSQTIPTR